MNNLVNRLISLLKLYLCIFTIMDSRGTRSWKYVSGLETSKVKWLVFI